MTVITPSQRQLIFTRSLGDNLSSHRSSEQRGIGGLDLREFIKGGLAARLLAFSLLLSFGGLLFFGIDAVLLSFKVKSVSLVLEQGRIQRESLETQKAQLLSLEALRDYASVVQLNQAQSVSYLTGSQLGLAQAGSAAARKSSAQ